MRFLKANDRRPIEKRFLFTFGQDGRFLFTVEWRASLMSKIRGGEGFETVAGGHHRHQISLQKTKNY